MTSSTDIAREVVRAEGGRTDAFRLQKLVYYSQAWFSTKYKRRLFSDLITAWDNGPVAESLWPLHKGLYSVTSGHLSRTDSERSLSVEEVDAVRAVVAFYAEYTTAQLVDLTHREDPWKNAYAAGRNTVISSASMREYYSRQVAEGKPAPRFTLSRVTYVSAAEMERLEVTSEEGTVNQKLLRALMQPREQG